ncbi:hypothetical protein Dsin_001028 [Dipteronia sinensis]|uniref:Zinc knuckle CX2CX4HX4C domain-containing protein n=1 Tax=Dipteronia sinensis TaxID=43782 RepID=A0AAE0EIL6_9ROSI|nr:hypothetical protein Dsin_001028 [Dipteronia sinensis]
MDSEDIAYLCASLSISECDGKLMDEAINRLSLYVVGKVLSRKRVNRDAFMRVIDAHDLNKVVSGSPWSFDNALIAMERPVEVDGRTSGDCVGKFLRIRVRVDITRSLKRCLRVDIFGNKTETVMLLSYDRLPNHCFRCGMVDHTTPECREKELGHIVNGKEVFPFGIWLRASGFLRKPFYQSYKGHTVPPVNSISTWSHGRANAVPGPEFTVGDGEESALKSSIFDRNVGGMDEVSAPWTVPVDPYNQSQMDVDHGGSEKDVVPSEGDVFVAEGMGNKIGGRKIRSPRIGDLRIIEERQEVRSGKRKLVTIGIESATSGSKRPQKIGGHIAAGESNDGETVGEGQFSVSPTDATEPSFWVRQQEWKMGT